MSRHPRASEDTDGFLKRWSRRKTGAGARDEAEQQPGSGDDARPTGERGGSSPGGEDAARPAESAEHAAVDPDKVKTDEDMPDLDSITDGSDMSDFFSPGVSEELRNQALRRLFRTSRFNVVDPLDDYNEDFRSFALLGDLVTSDMRHRAEMDEQRRREAAESSGASPDAEPTAAETVEETERADQQPDSVDTADADDEQPADDADTDSSDAPSRNTI